MLQNVHYFDQISNVRYANKVCFFRTYKTPQTLEITRIAGLLFKSTLFFASSGLSKKVTKKIFSYKIGQKRTLYQFFTVK